MIKLPEAASNVVKKVSGVGGDIANKLKSNSKVAGLLAAKDNIDKAMGDNTPKENLYRTESDILNFANYALVQAENIYNDGYDLEPFKIIFTSYTEDPQDRNYRVEGFLPEAISFDIQSQFAPLFEQSAFGDNLFSKVMKAHGVSGLTQGMTFKFWQSSSGMSFSIPIVIDIEDDYPDNSIDNAQFYGFTQSNSGSSIIMPQYTDYRGVLEFFAKQSLPSKKTDNVFLSAPGPVIKYDAENVSLEELGGGLYDIGAAGVTATAAVAVDLTERTTGIGSRENVQQMYSSAKEKLQQGTSRIESTLNQVNQQRRLTVRIGKTLYLDNIVIDGFSVQAETQPREDGHPRKITLQVNFSTVMMMTYEDFVNAVFNA